MPLLVYNAIQNCHKNAREKLHFLKLGISRFHAYLLAWKLFAIPLSPISLWQREYNSTVWCQTTSHQRTIMQETAQSIILAKYNGSTGKYIFKYGAWYCPSTKPILHLSCEASVHWYALYDVLQCNIGKIIARCTMQ